MARILVHVEGQTEETFVRDILASHLLQYGHHSFARLVGNARMRSRRGGIKGWDSVGKDIINHLTEDATSYSTTMIDYYALPQSGPGAWPGRAAAGLSPYVSKSAIVTSALANDIAARMGGGFDPARFIPYVMMHEFEGLLFSGCAAFARGIGREDLILALQQVREQFRSPEEINDSPITAPSKRVADIVRGYEKPLMGTLAVIEIGLDTIRSECPHFDAWIKLLESIP